MAVPDWLLSGEGPVLPLGVQHGILQAQRLHRLRLPPEAAIAQAALAPLHLGRQPAAATTNAAATLWVVAGHGQEEEGGEHGQHD